MKLANKKTFKIIGMTALMLLFTAVTVCGISVWYTAYCRIGSIKNEFLVRHRPYMRAGEITPGNFNELNFKNVELGSAAKPFLTADRAVLQMKSQFSSSLAATVPEKLKLYNVPVVVAEQQSGKLITVNGIELSDFITQLLEIPFYENNNQLSIEINGTLQMGFQKPSSSIKLLISGDPSAKDIKFFAEWQSLQAPEINGWWKATLDLASGTLVADIRKSIDIAFFQELMLRSRVNERAVELLQDGDITGIFMMVATYPNLKINELEFKGKIDNAKLKWYKYNIDEVDQFDLYLIKAGRQIQWKIPQLTIKMPFCVDLRDISMKQNQNNLLEVAARCDLRQAAVNFFTNKLALPEVSINTTSDVISGEWNMRNHQWKLSGKTSSWEKSNNVLFNDDENSQLMLTPDRFEFKADGTGSLGSFSQLLDFSDFNLNVNQNKCSIDRGSFYTTATLGDRSASASDTLEFSFNNFYANTPGGQYTLCGFAGQLNLRLFEKQKDLYLIARGTSGDLQVASRNIKMPAWQCNVNAEPGAQKEWKLSGLLFETASMSVTQGNKNTDLTDLTIRGNGLLREWQLADAQIQLLATAINNDKMVLKKPHFTFQYLPASGDKQDNWHTIFNCKEVKLPEPRWGVSELTDCKLQFTGTDLQKLPNKLSLSASGMKMQHGIWHSNLLNSNWQLNKLTDDQWDCQLKFAALKLASTDQKYGNLSFGDGNIAVQLTGENSNIKNFSLVGEADRPAWNCGSLGVSGDMLLCDITNKNNVTTSSSRLTNSSISSEYFTAMTPQLLLHTSISSQDTISGNIEFAQGTLTSPEGALEMHDVSFKLPFTASSQRPEKLEEGSFNAGKVYYLGENEGSFTGTLQHFLLLSEAMQQARNHSLNIKGKFTPSKFASSTVNVNAYWQLPPEQSAMTWVMDMPESELAMPLDLTRYFKLPLPATILRGKVGLNITLEKRSNESPRFEIAAELINSDWQIDKLTAESVTSNFYCNMLNNGYSIAPHTISVGKLRWQNWQLDKNELTLALNPQWQLMISGWKGSLLNGKFNLSAPLTIGCQNMNQDIDMSFDLQQVPSEKFFNMLGVKYIQSDMLLAGQVNPYWASNRNRIYFHDSKLANQTPDGAVLQITAPPATIRVSDSNYRNFALAVLKAMNCKRSSFDFSTQPEEVKLKLSAEGAPVRPVPFVYRGRSAGNIKSPFRPADAGEEGFAGELDLTINFKLEPEEPIL